MLVAFNRSRRAIFTQKRYRTTFPLVARNAADILNLGVTRAFQKRESLAASRPCEAMDENRRFLFRIFPKHTLDIVKGNVDAPGNMPLPIFLFAANVDQNRAIGRAPFVNAPIDSRACNQIDKAHTMLPAFLRTITHSGPCPTACHHLMTTI